MPKELLYNKRNCGKHILIRLPRVCINALQEEMICTLFEEVCIWEKASAILYAILRNKAK